VKRRVTLLCSQGCGRAPETDEKNQPKTDPPPHPREPTSMPYSNNLARRLREREAAAGLVQANALAISQPASLTTVELKICVDLGNVRWGV
jgi:hypothetical protein